MIGRTTDRAAYARILLSFSLGACLLNGQTSSAPSPAPALKETVEKIVRDYILENPALVMESLRGLQEKSRAAEALKSRGAISARQAELAKDNLAPAAGDLSSNVTLTFFFDYRCGYCKKVTADLLPFTKAGSPVRVVFKELPILGPESEAAARAALAAGKQKAYLPFHQALMGHQGAFTQGAFEEIARSLGLDVTQWKADLGAPDVGQTIQLNQELAASIGIQATPSFVAGTELAAGALDAKGFAALIERAKSKEPIVAAAR